MPEVAAGHDRDNGELLVPGQILDDDPMSGDRLQVDETILSVLPVDLTALIVDDIFVFQPLSVDDQGGTFPLGEQALVGRHLLETVYIPGAET